MQDARAHYFHRELLDCYAETFDLGGMALDVALRHFLQAFTLPGEAQKIDRIMEAFARRFVTAFIVLYVGLIT